MSNPRFAYNNSACARQLKAHYSKQDAGVLMAEEILKRDEHDIITFIQSVADNEGKEALQLTWSYLSDICDAKEREAIIFEAYGQLEKSIFARQEEASLRKIVKEIDAVTDSYQGKVNIENNDSDSVMRLRR